jgi:hypothetical protein
VVNVGNHSALLKFTLFFSSCILPAALLQQLTASRPNPSWLPAKYRTCTDLQREDSCRLRPAQRLHCSTATRARLHELQTFPVNTELTRIMLNAWKLSRAWAVLTSLGVHGRIYSLTLVTFVNHCRQGPRNLER